MSDSRDEAALHSARTAAARGAWLEVRVHLEADSLVVQRDGARAILLAEACLRTGDSRAAYNWLETATPLLARAGDRPAERRAVNMQGAAAFALGILDSAAERFGSALEMARADGDVLLTARAINNLGAIDSVRGDTDAAITGYQLAIAAYQRLGHTLGLAESWHNLGISYRTSGELDAAEEAERKASEFAGECGNTRVSAMAQVGRAEISLRRGDFALARANASRAATTFSLIADYLLQADALRVQAEASDRLRFPIVADALLVKAYQLARGYAHRLQEAQILQTHAQIHLRRGKLVESRATGLEALSAFRELGSGAGLLEMTAFLARLDG